MEILEARQLLAQVSWINPAGGSWAVGSNWSSGVVPGPSDDVAIDVSGATPTITIDSGNQSINADFHGRENNQFFRDPHP